MTQTLLKHKGYTGSVEVSIQDACLHGRILHIDDLVTYEGENVPEISQRFVSAVDEYLAHCAAIEKQPARPYSGTLNVRIGPDLHRQVAEWASVSNVSLNEAICRAVKLLVQPDAVEQPAAVFRDQVFVTLKPEGREYRFLRSETDYSVRVYAGAH